jgi:hypothetical protein
MRRYQSCREKNGRNLPRRRSRPSLAETGEPEEKRELCEELAEIEEDLGRQLVKVYRRGTNFEEFWDLVERPRSFSEMRKNICG